MREKDISYPDVNSLPKLAEIFGMSVDELMQVKDGKAQKGDNKSIGETVSLVFRAVCLAMGIAVVVLKIIEQISNDTAIIMLAIGVAGAGISLLRETP